MRGGRFACVALPIILLLAAIIALLVGSLSGIAHNRLYMFKIDLEDLSISEANVQNIVDNLDIKLPDNVPDIPDIPTPNIGKRQDKTSNITAADLGLGKSYEITLWGYCENKQNGKTDCVKGEFDWASKRLNTDFLDDFGSAAGVNIELPKEIKDALSVFKTVTKWTEVAFIICLVALGIELVVGIFATCTRVIACLTWLIAIVAMLLTIAACTLATVMSAVVVGAVEGTAKFYGVKGDINTQYLACIWIGAAFSIAASLFWLFTICCCKPDHNRGRDKRRSDGEKLLPTQYSGGYAPVGNDNEGHGQHYNTYQPSYESNNNAKDYHWDHSGSHAQGHSNNHHNGAYEPYSHQ